MATTAAIPRMKASTLAIMGTRLEDQDLVAQVARSHPSKVVPSFGYHPWFSHLIHDDRASFDGDGEETEGDLKLRHYSAVLTPPPDADFILQLPRPRPLSAVLEELRRHLVEFPHALVGEIGLDRVFRLPQPTATQGPAGSTPGRRDTRALTQHRVALPHQKAIFLAQLGLAGELERAVSVHGVQCHGFLFDAFREVWAGHEIPRERPKDRKRRRRKTAAGDHEFLPDLAGSDIESDEESGPAPKPKPFPPRVCLHSFSGPLETLKQYLAPPTPTKLYPSQLFFSFSSTINARPEKGHLSKIEDTIKTVPDENVLIESDLHTAGDDMDDALEGALRLVVQLKRWDLQHGAEQLDRNWRRFVYGDAE